MISFRTVKLLPLLATPLDTTDKTNIGNAVINSANTFRPGPAAKTSTAPITFAQVQQMQKIYSIRRAHNLESVGRIELYEQWSIKIIEMMEFYGTRQKCQNCGHGHKSEGTAVQWIKWHGTLLGLKVEILSETSFDLLVFMARIIEVHYHEHVRGSACKKHSETRAEKCQDISAKKDEGNTKDDKDTE